MAALLVAFGGLVLFACGLSLFWGFSQYKTLATSFVRTQAQLKLDWVRSEVQGAVKQASAPPSAREVWHILTTAGIGKSADEAVYVYVPAELDEAARVAGGGPDGTLALNGTSGITEVPGAEDGEVVELTVKNCPQVGPTPDRPDTEIDRKGKMRLITKGEFLMGDDQGEANERPAHPVNIDYDYYIDKFEVTNQQYREFSNSPRGRPFPGEPNWDPNYSSKLDHPVAGVSWEDARAYCEEWAGKRLPTEAEWEKAASWDPNATEPSTRWKRYWPWGNVFNPNNANFNSGRAKTVGQFQSGLSAYGVYDMAGNVSEWVNDSYQPYPNNSVQDTNYGGSYRVLRGGTFKLGISKDALRTTRRYFSAPTFSQGERAGTAFLIGFRCAVSLKDLASQEQRGIPSGDGGKR